MDLDVFVRLQLKCLVGVALGVDQNGLLEPFGHCKRMFFPFHDLGLGTPFELTVGVYVFPLEMTRPK